MFKKVTKFIVNQVDPRKELVPVESIADHEHFRPFCLLKKKNKPKSIFHSAPYYQRTGFRLNDVLLPGEDGESTESLLPTGDGQDFSQFTLTKVTADQIDGDLSLNVVPTSVELKGGASLSKEFRIKPQKKVVSLESLEAVRRKRQINMDHSFIRQLQRTDLSLYVVYETLEASEEAVYRESTKADGSFRAKIYATLSAKGSKENKQGIVIPRGCTLAFRAIQLYISDGGWDLDYFQTEAVTCFSYVADGISEGKLEIVVGEVKHRCQIFSKLSPDLLLMFLNTIKAVMRDRNLFQELSQKMEEVAEETDGYELKTESPDLRDLLSTLEGSPKGHGLQLAGAITYILDALAELLEDQLLLLLESLERKIVSQQLKLVGNLLKHNLDQGKKPFCVDTSLLCFPREEEQIWTMALVELSGVKLQEDGSAVPMEQPFEAMAALYVSLHVLNLLSGSQ